MRKVLIYTPNFGVKPFTVVYDGTKSSKNKYKNMDAAAKHYEELPAEDRSLKGFLVPPDYPNEKLCEAYNKAMEIALPKSMYYSDLGVYARRFVDDVREAIEKFDSARYGSEVS